MHSNRFFDCRNQWNETSAVSFVFYEPSMFRQHHMSCCKCGLFRTTVEHLWTRFRNIYIMAFILLILLCSVHTAQPSSEFSLTVKRTLLFVRTLSTYIIRSIHDGFKVFMYPGPTYTNCLKTPPPTSFSGTLSSLLLYLVVIHVSKCWAAVVHPDSTGVLEQKWLCSNRTSWWDAMAPSLLRFQNNWRFPAPQHPLPIALINGS